MVPTTRWATAADGTCLAYQVVGEGSVDVAFLPGWSGNVEIPWEYPPVVSFLRSMASFCRPILPGSEPFWFMGDTRPLLQTIRGFLGVPSPAPGLDTILSTVLCTDIVGSTEKQAALGDHGWKDLVERHHAIAREGLARWHGVENDTAGDGFYATFEGPARAIRCDLQVADRVRDLGIEVRAGVHTGECELIGSKCAGLTVSIGARLAANAGPSEVLVSQTVKDLVAGSGHTFEDGGEHELKGVPDS